LKNWGFPTSESIVTLAGEKPGASLIGWVVLAKGVWKDGKLHAERITRVEPLTDDEMLRLARSLKSRNRDPAPVYEQLLARTKDPETRRSVHQDALDASEGAGDWKKASALCDEILKSGPDPVIEERRGRYANWASKTKLNEWASDTPAHKSLAEEPTPELLARWRAAVKEAADEPELLAELALQGAAAPESAELLPKLGPSGQAALLDAYRGRIEKNKAVPGEAIEPLARGGDLQVRLRAIAILGALKKASALISLLEDPDPAVRSEAIYAIASAGGPQAKEALQKREPAASGEEKAQILEALKRMQ
jgi:hypothetical protein